MAECKQSIFSWKNKRQQASLSLFMCGIFIVLLSVNLMLVTAAKTRVLENRLAATMVMEGERALADYDPELYARFGLWAVTENSLSELASDHEVKRSLQALPGSGGIHFLGTEELSHERLKKQIAHFMKARFPQLLIERLGNMAQEVNQLSQSRELTAFRQNLNQDLIVKGYENFSRWLGNADGHRSSYEKGKNEMEVGADSEGEAQSTASEKISNEEENETMKLGGDLLLELEHIVRGSLAVPIPTAEANGASPLDASALSDLLDLANRLFTYDLGAGYDKILLSMYGCMMFPSLVHKENIAADYPYKKSPSAQALLLDEALAKHSSEYILTGLEDAGSQRSRLNLYLYAIRFFCQCGGILQNEAKMQSFRSSASILSIVVGVLSQGSLSIPPDALVAIFVTTNALVSASSDVARLLSAQSVVLFPNGKSGQIVSWYHDYLAIMFLLLPEAALLSRVEEAYQALLPGRYFVALEVHLDWGNPFLRREKKAYRKEMKYAVNQDLSQ